jgi:hypothetical protein
MLASELQIGPCASTGAAAITAGLARTADVMDLNVGRNFRAKQHGAHILYYAFCIRKLYTAISKLPQIRATSARKISTAGGGVTVH